tara:strand:- start:102 stop:380 length:279 start_codon:yes stop_codon:yes gene_type:complete
MSNIQILDQKANLVSVTSDKAPSTRRNLRKNNGNSVHVTKNYVVVSVAPTDGVGGSTVMNYYRKDTSLVVINNSNKKSNVASKTVLNRALVA